MQTYDLITHPAHPPVCVAAVRAKVFSLSNPWLRVRWHVEGISKLVLPPFAGRGRADNLWRTTCFELFVQAPGAQAYSEFNFSPSQRWAAYDFTSERTGMKPRTMVRPPECTLRMRPGAAIFDATMPCASLPQIPAAIGINAVIEELGGARSYWALRHRAARPDFHDPACFTGTLGPRKPI